LALVSSSSELPLLALLDGYEDKSMEEEEVEETLESLVESES
jgi:hypothetical protein